MTKQLETTYIVERFALAGLVSGFVCSIFWDPDDYGLIIMLAPGWFFGMSFSLALFSSVIDQDIRSVIKVIVWIIICALCFLGAFSLVSNDIGLNPLFSSAIAGFVTTFIMVTALRLLFGAPSIVSALRISLVAGVLSSLGIYFFLITENTAPLFMMYHIVVGTYLGYLMQKYDLKRPKSVV